MRAIIVLLTFASIGAGIKYDGLKVKFGWSDALADIQYFFTIPRTITEAEGEGWHRTERPKGPMKELRMYCPPGRNVCPLYDTAGFVAGLQIAVPVESMDPDLKPERYFVKWSAPGFDGEPAQDYWTAAQYYVTEDSLKAGAGPTTANGATLQDGGVWVKGLNGKMLKIPASEAELNTTDFKKQNCVPNMGTHYYHNMTRQLSCDKPQLPWFALVTKGKLLGVGFQTYGRKPKVSRKYRDWFEDAPSELRTALLLGSPHAPECLLTNSQLFGRLSLHIYYISKPWQIRCETGDSIEPAPILDRLMLSGARYVTQIGDEIQKLISGIIIQANVPEGPECLYEHAADRGVVTMHIYYVDEPWTILFC